MDGPGEVGSDKGQVGTDDIPEGLHSQFGAIIAFQANIGDAAPLTFEDLFSLAFGHSEVVACRLNEYQAAKEAA